MKSRSRTGDEWGSTGKASRKDRGSQVSSGGTRVPSGKAQSYHSANGGEARYRPDGRIHTVQARGMTITHGRTGSARIMTRRPDHSVVVSDRNGHGYLQRPFQYRNREFVNRTYYMHGNAYSRYYRSYSYRGMALEAYVPVRYYSPAFYGWAYHPWDRPVSYGWGWGGSPWYGYYSGYFAPAQFYPGPSLWLADYMLSTELAEAYQDQAAGQAQAFNDPNPGGSVTVTPEVKQLIANEVQQQLALENAEGQSMAQNILAEPESSGLPRLLGDNKPHGLVVSYDIEVADAAGQGCMVTRGDVLKLTSPPPPDATQVYVQVVASKGDDCSTGSMVAVSLQDLQDMHNQMRETLDRGLGVLQSQQGQRGLPPLPPAAAGPPVSAAFAEVAPPPDPNVASELRQQVQEADRVEQEIATEAKAADSGRGVEIGQTTTQVLSLLGDPRRIRNKGHKQIYLYPHQEVTFVSDEVSAVKVK